MTRLGDPRRGIWIGAALLLCAASLALFWPGVAEYDSIAQYGEVLAGSYDDWHPPAMAELWGLLHRVFAGQAPMFALQMGLYWLGLGLIAGGLARQGGRIAAGAVLALGAFPLFLGWEAIVLKDAQLLASLVAATGIVAWWRLAEQRVPWWAAALAALLLVYATLVRANGAFASVPLAFGLFAIGAQRPLPVRFGLMLAAMVTVVAASPLVNRRLFDAQPSGVERVLPTYDLAGIAHFAGPRAVPLLEPEMWQEVAARRCYQPLFWDPLGDVAHCDFVAETLRDHAPGSALFLAWIRAIASHPFGYAAHRLVHWNATMRWLVPAHWPLSNPAARSEPNDMGLGSPGGAAHIVDLAADALADGPWGVPILWYAAALGALAAASGSDPRQQLARTLAGSAVALQTSFLVVSIASDLRYHLWAMLATGIAWCLLAGTPLRRGALDATLAALLLLGLSGFAARLVLPPSLGTYAAALTGS